MIPSERHRQACHGNIGDTITVAYKERLYSGMITNIGVTQLHSKLKALSPLVFLLLSAFFGVPALVHPARATTAGLVCIADQSLNPTDCPSSPAILAGEVGSTITVAVNVQGSDSLNAFDITIQVNPAVLQPLSVSLADSVIQEPRVVLVESANSTSGVTRVATAALGYAVPGAGNLFEIFYRVLSSGSGTSIAFGGCGNTRSTPFPCVELANPGHVPVTLQTASFGLVMPDFLVSVSAASRSVQAGFSVNTTIVLSSIGEFNNPVNLSVAPVGRCPSTACPSATLGEETIMLSPDGISLTTLTFTAPPEQFDAPTIDLSINVTGTSGSLSHSVVAAFTVLPPDLSIEVASNYQAVRSGSTGNATIVLRGIGGFGVVKLAANLTDYHSPDFNPVCAASACPSWSLSPTTLAVSPDATSQTTLAFSNPPAQPNATVTYWGFGVRAISSNLSRYAFVQFTVIPPADFSISADPSTLTVERGQSNVASIRISGVQVSLSVSISPNIEKGPTISLQYERYGPALLVSTDGTTYRGTYTVTVTGSNLWNTHSFSVTVVVGGFGGGCSSSCRPHGPITIRGNADFNSANGVTGGTGTPSDPYLIQGLDIEIIADTPAIQIRNTSAYFEIRNVYIHSYCYECSGIVMTNVENGALEDSQIAVYSSSLTLDSSRNIMVSGDEVAWISIDASDNVTVSDSGGKTCYDISCYGGFIVTTSSDNVTLVRNTFSRFQILDSTRVIAENNTLTGRGIEISGTTPEHFDSHTITPDNTVNGRPLLYYKDCSGLNLSSIELGELIVAHCTGFKVDNLAFRGDAQIEMAFVNEAIIENVTGYPTVHVLNSTYVELSRANVSSIDVESTTGVTISDSASNILVSSSTNAYIFDDTGTVRVVNSSNVTISGSALGSCDCNAVSIQDSSYVRVSANHLEGEPSVVVADSSFVEVLDNQITGPIGAIELRACSDVSVLRNRLAAGDGGDTVALVSECERVSISENTISPCCRYDTSYLLDVSRSNNVTITGNNLSNSTVAVRVTDSSDLTINDNNIRSNAQGVVLNDTMNIRVFHNNFLNNTLRASDTYATYNVWDNGYPSGGNYWSDYTGVDNCAGAMQNLCPSPDGIGDTAYSFSFGNDRYPLTQPFAPSVTGTLQYNPSRIVFQHTPKYLTIVIKMPSGANATNVVASSLRLNDTVSMASGPAAFQVINGGREVMVRFPMSKAMGLIPRQGSYVLRVSANILTATNFMPFVALGYVRFVAGG